MEKYKIYKIHFFYTIGILILAIIGLITVKWGEVPKLVEYITFALTLTSLTLSLLAIIYSLFSNSKLSESIGSLDSASKEVINSTSKLSDVTKELGIKIESIPNSLKSVEEKTEKTHKLIEEIQNLKEPIIETPDESIEEKIEVNTNLFSSDLELFVINTSFSGKLLLYASSLSNKYTKGFSFDEIFVSNREYTKGFLVACSSLGILEYTETKDIYIVTKLNEIIESNIEKYITESAQKHDKGKDVEYLEKYSWMSLKNKIKSYFDDKQ